MARPVFAFDPTVTIAGVREFETAGRTESIAETTLHFLAELGKAHVLDRVFQARVLAIDAIAVVALHEDDFLGHIHGLIHRAEAHDIRDARIGFGLVVRHAETAADSDIEARELSVRIRNRDETEIVAEDVD